MIRQKGIVFSMIFLGILMAVASCERYPDPKPVFEPYGKDSSSGQQRKVLMISIDGATGSEIQKIAPPNITALEKHGKYTYNVLTDVVATDASSWVSLLTGVGYGKHQITDSSFQYIPSDDISSEEHSADPVPYFPTVFSYILQSKPDYKMAVITPWAGLANYARIVDYAEGTANDEAAKDSAVSILKRVNSLGVMTVDFNEAELAGNAGSFSSSDAGYKAAVLKADGYVGDIMKALQSRKNFSTENWLVIITTNHGGSATNPKPGFIVYSNPALQEEEVKKAGFSAVSMQGSGSEATYATMDPVVNGTRVYDFQKDFTIQFDALFGNSSGAYPYFFGNKWQLNGSTFPGFSFLIDYYPTWTFNTTSGRKFQVGTNTQALGDGDWHTVAVTVKEETDGSRTVSAYTDGVLKGHGTLPSNANLNSDYPLTVGWMKASGGADYMQTTVHNIKLFDVALDTTGIKDNKCIKDITKSPEYSDLVGFWPCDEATGGVFFNAINSNAPFIVHGSPKWENMGNNVPCSVDPPAGDEANQLSIVTSTVDVSANMLYWLKIKASADWNMDGQPWLNNFEKEIFGVK